MSPRQDATVRVVYALPQRQHQAIVHLLVGENMTVAQAVERSGLLERFAEISASPLKCAIYGQVAPLSRIVRPGDRVEILRPLLIDPKESRRQAAARSRSRPR
ncbi:MAG TPA: RnfH family protein [Steroidobacter sp.]|nr:RnfH family protein [Steroidobacter sp.]